MKAICEDDEHQEEVPFRNTVVVFDKEENMPKRVCGECSNKQKYRK